MFKATNRRYWAGLSALALAAGAAAAEEIHHPGMEVVEVVEVVEKLTPALVTSEDYFRPVEEELTATMGNDLGRALTASVMSGHEQLVAELDLASGPRVAANGSGHLDGALDGEDSSLSPGVNCWKTCF